jgi:type IV pilus assembly protein PilA
MHIRYHSCNGITPAADRQTGFTIIELLITVAIIGILLNVAIVSYRDYQIRTRVSSGISLSAGVKTAVADYFSNHARMPSNNPDAGLPAASTINSEYVNSIGIGTTPVTGTITISYRDIPGISSGATALLQPAMAQAGIKWTCKSRTIRDKHLPSSCRG